MADKAWTVGGLSQAGGETTIRTSSGELLKGINNGGNGGISVGGKTYYPV